MDDEIMISEFDAETPEVASVLVGVAKLCGVNAWVEGSDDDVVVKFDAHGKHVLEFVNAQFAAFAAAGEVATDPTFKKRWLMRAKIAYAYSGLLEFGCFSIERVKDNDLTELMHDTLRRHGSTLYQLCLAI